MHLYLYLHLHMYYYQTRLDKPCSRFSILDPRFSALDSRFTILDPRSSIFDFSNGKILQKLIWAPPSAASRLEFAIPLSSPSAGCEWVPSKEKCQAA